ncbi:hypothetical protein [Pseudidiomarina mangrovi]|uniref:hypothetical protein n=1 Tax=Pseudidiomarina mangrovi TaxID=2487133 RepID=UPI000FCC6180|nr:hypothetical protein [Pseudidiomarina mangrovi]
MEHMIPNAALSRKRGKGEGDFLACRKCNSHKSNMDYVIGVISKSQSANSNLVVDSLTRASTQTDGREKRFLDMMRTAVCKPDGNIHLEIPIHADDLISYMRYLGMGQYFKIHKRPFNPERYVMHLEFINKQVTQTFQASYQDTHYSNPFLDIQENPHAEVIGDGEVIIWYKKDAYLFLFHHYVGFLIDIKKRCRRHTARAEQKEAYIRKHFRYGKLN